MSDDQNGKSGGWFGNPLPIMMVVLLAAGVLVKNVPLESARPTDAERVKFAPTGQQDVEARLWQDPFAAVEKYKKSSNQAVAPTEKASLDSHPPDRLHSRITDQHGKMIVVAVSVFGGSYAEDAESRRRSRFAVVSALGFHDYHPESNDTIGYFRIDPSEPKSNARKPTYDDDVPYEWFEWGDKSRSVLVLWLKDEKLTATPLTTLNDLFNKLMPDSRTGLTVKFIGPAGSGTLRDLVREGTIPNQNPVTLKTGSAIEFYSPSATISNCDLLNQEGSQPQLNCFENPPSLLERTTLPIVRTIGSDDVLAASLLWELWQRGVNRDAWAKKDPAERTCEDGLVLIGERDTEYGRTLARYLRDGFSDRCGITPDGKPEMLRSDRHRLPPVRTFTYLRGLDGVLADSDKSGSKTPAKEDSGKSKDLRAQLDDAPPEHAEGRSQFDYLRRLADEIDRLDHDKTFFAKNGVKAIGIVGSDLYDKLLILQALRSRFKDKIFFTTDLDARYLHADQKDWARNLVVVSNFGLSLNQELQKSTLPFRDGYQTATYLATLMAVGGMSIDDWTDKKDQWLRPKTFEIGRTEAVHLASPSVERLKNWGGNHDSEDRVLPAKVTPCDGSWKECNNIEPIWPSRGIELNDPWPVFFMVCFGLLLVTLTSRCVHHRVRTAIGAPSPERDAARAMIYLVSGAVIVVVCILARVSILMNVSLAQGVGEPFLWFEGISVWPSLVVRFVGLVTMLGLWYAFLKMIQQKEKPDKDFEIALPKPRTLNRSKLSAWLNGPHLNLALFDQAGHAEAGSAVKEETRGKKIIDVATLWQNYLRATSWREMAGWIMVSLLIGLILIIATFQVLDSRPSFPHRGDLVKNLHLLLVSFNALVLWLAIFWVGYETRVCARFIETLSNVPNEWPDQLLARTEKETGVPRAHLDDYLDFRLIVHATQRIDWLIYLPFVGIFFMVLSRSNFFDAMDFPPALFFIVGLALGYSLLSAILLRRSAESARGKAIEYYERQLLIQARVKDSQPPILIVDPISVEQIKLLMERIRNNREGAFAPFAQQPALQALLLPFGGYGSVQIIEYLFKL